MRFGEERSRVFKLKSIHDKDSHPVSLRRVQVFVYRYGDCDVFSAIIIETC